MPNQKEDMQVTHQCVNFIQRALKARFKQLYCVVRHNSMSLHSTYVQGRAGPHHSSTRPSSSIFKPRKQSAWRWLERTICFCRWQKRTTFHAKESKPGPQSGLLLSFMFSKERLPSSLGNSKSLEFRPAGMGRPLIILQNNKPRDGISKQLAQLLSSDLAQ